MIIRVQPIDRGLFPARERPAQESFLIEARTTENSLNPGQIVVLTADRVKEIHRVNPVTQSPGGGEAPHPGYVRLPSDLPPAREGTVRMYHGTSSRGLALAQETGAFRPLDPEEVAHQVEKDLGLPPGTVWDHRHNWFSRDRKADPNVYLTDSLRVASMGAEASLLKATCPGSREISVGARIGDEAHLCAATGAAVAYLVSWRRGRIVAQVGIGGISSLRASPTAAVRLALRQDKRMT